VSAGAPAVVAAKASAVVGAEPTEAIAGRRTDKCTVASRYMW